MLCLLGSQQSSGTASVPKIAQANPLQAALYISLCPAWQYMPVTVRPAVTDLAMWVLDDMMQPNIYRAKSVK